MKKFIALLLITALLLSLLAACGGNASYAPDVSTELPTSPPQETAPPPTAPPTQEPPPEEFPNYIELPPAQRYIMENTGADIFDYFQRAAYIGAAGNFGFSSPGEISSSDLFRFAILAVDTTGMYDKYKEWYRESEQKFYIPVSDITDILDVYFEGYTFITTEVIYADYNSSINEFETTALGFGMGAWNPSLGGIKLIDDNTIEVILLDSYGPDSIVKAKVTEEGVRFLSHLRISG